MSLIEVGCQLKYQIASRTVFLFNIGITETENQILNSESFQTLPHTPLQILQTTPSANRLHRAICEPGEFELNYRASVLVQPTVQSAPELLEQPHSELPAEVLTFLNPSRYCESDRLAAFAESEFGNAAQGYHRVKSICDWTFQHLAYVPGTTDSLTTACDVLIQRTGVCRDFAHLAIALCRGLGIPARYVAGYAVDLNPPDFHGFFEAYLGDRWYLFDPTRLAPIGGLVRISTGHDAADTAFATLTGTCQLTAKQVFATATQPSELLQKDPSVVGLSTAASDE